MGQPQPLFVYFRSFQTNNTIYTTNHCEKMSKCPSSIWRWDSNPRPLKHELSPITTRPGLLPYLNIFQTLKNPGRRLRTSPSLVLLDNLFSSFFVGWAISRCLSTTPHPIIGQGR